LDFEKIFKWFIYYFILLFCYLIQFGLYHLGQIYIFLSLGLNLYFRSGPVLFFLFYFMDWALIIYLFSGFTSSLGPNLYFCFLCFCELDWGCLSLSRFSFPWHMRLGWHFLFQYFIFIILSEGQNLYFYLFLFFKLGRDGMFF